MLETLLSRNGSSIRPADAVTALLCLEHHIPIQSTDALRDIALAEDSLRLFKQPLAYIEGDAKRLLEALRYGAWKIIKECTFTDAELSRALCELLAYNSITTQPLRSFQFARAVRWAVYHGHDLSTGVMEVALEKLQYTSTAFVRHLQCDAIARLAPGFPFSHLQALVDEGRLRPGSAPAAMALADDAPLWAVIKAGPGALPARWAAGKDKGKSNGQGSKGKKGK